MTRRSLLASLATLPFVRGLAAHVTPKPSPAAIAIDKALSTSLVRDACVAPYPVMFVSMYRRAPLGMPPIPEAKRLTRIRLLEELQS